MRVIGFALVTQRLRKLAGRLRRRLSSEPPITATTVRVSSLLYADAAEPLSLPMIPLALAQAGEEASSIEFAAASVLDRVALAALTKRQHATRLFEIGTFRGVTALTLAANAPEGSVLYTLDLPPEMTPAAIAATHYAASSTSGFDRLAASNVGRDVGRLLPSHSGSCKIEQIFGDSATLDFSRFHGSIDLFFVDGCHAYEAALRDTRTAWRCLRPGGLIVWHDYRRPDVQRAVVDAKVGPVTRIADTNLAYAIKPA